MIKEIIFFVRGNGTVSIMVATPIFMLANMLGGMALAGFKDKFDWEVVKVSIIKYIFILLIAGMLYVGGRLSNQALLDFAQIDVGFDVVISLGIATLGGSYAAQAVNKFYKLVGVSTANPNASPIAQTVSIKLDADEFGEMMDDKIGEIKRIQNEEVDDYGKQ